MLGIGLGLTMVRASREPQRNVLTYTEQFNQAAWTKTNSSVSADAVAAPGGTLTADKITEAVTTSNKEIGRNMALTAGQRVTYSVHALAGERSRLRIGASGSTLLSTPPVFDLTAGTVAVNPAGASSSASITDAGGGWWRCALTLTHGGANGSFGFFLTLADTSNATNYTGVSGSGLYLWGAQFEPGALTAYQRIDASY